MRRIKKAKINFISLVPAGANKIAPVYKTDGSVTFGTLVKADGFEDRGELTAIVYAPNMVDSQGDVADREVVKQMAYDFIANGAAIDIKHDGKALPHEKARVAETFIVQKTDTRFHGWKDRDGKDVDLEGAWATVIKIDDPDLRKRYKNGEWAGVSMGGTAVVEQEKADVERLVELLAKAINPPKEPDTHMTPQELETITKTFKEGFTTMAAELVKALKPETPPAPKPEDKKVEEPKAPIFKGSLDDDRAVELHARQVELFNLKKSVDWSDAASIRSYKEQVAVRKAEWKEQDEADGIDTSEKQPVRKAGPANGEGAPNVPELKLVGLSKDAADMLKAGMAHAAAIETARKAK